ncbi:MAG: AAA family ATPase [Ramlibacter sp.]|nr:AAA family ATPase [Ramlibacter sp.]
MALVGKEEFGTGQRRHMTVLFADVSGSSELAERLEAEEFSELLEQFRRIAREVIPRHGGNIARLQGDGLLALFGHLEASEDDGRRAVEAALELHQAASRLSAGSGSGATQMQMHSGIHAGLVLVIAGDIERGRFDIVGEVPNTAARLCSLAATGEILVSEETLGPQAHFFKMEMLRRLPIRGRVAPLNVLRVAGRVAIQRRIDAAAHRGVVPFIGRAEALAELFGAVDRARNGESPVIVVSGEPGIGKTRLIEEFRRRLDPVAFRVMQGYCENYLGAEPLQPFMQWIRGALGRRPGGSPQENERATDRAPEAPGITAPAASTPAIHALMRELSAQQLMPKPAVLVAAALDLIAVLAQQQTLILVLDDWQWADDASHQALQSLRARQLPLLLLLASRPQNKDDDPVLADAQNLRLEPLDSGEGAGAISAWLPSAEPFLAQEIYRQSGGSPLFIEELCHAAAQGDLKLASGAGGAAWINALVASRLERLPGPQADFLRMASVAGNVFPEWVLKRVVGEGEAAALSLSLSAKDFLVPAGQPGMLRFKHVLTRDAVYATVNPGRRRALHLRVAQILEEAVGSEDVFDWLEALSYHYDSAGVWDKAADYAEAAGNKALAAMALDRARTQFLTALRSLDAASELTRPLQLRWCAIAQKLGQTCVFDPLDVGHGLELFERAARLARAAGDENTLARAEYWLGYVNYGKGRPREAVRHCESALVHALASDDQRLAAQVKAALGQSLASAGQYERALPLLTQAVESKRQQSRIGSGTAIGSAYTLARTAYTLGDLGRFEQAHATFAKALRLLGGDVHSVAASVRGLICAVHLWQGRWLEARIAGLDGAAIALQCRSRYLLAMGRALSACGGWALNGDATSLQLLRESTAWIQARGGAVSTSLNYGWLVEAAVSLDLETEARQHAAKLLQRARAQDRHGEAMGCRALARMAASQGNVERARHYMAAADRAAAFRQSPRERAVNQLAGAGLALAAGAAGQAKALAEIAAQAFEALQMDWHLAQAQALLQSL